MWNLLNLNAKGIGVFAVMGIGFLIVILIPIALIELNEMSKILFQIILVFSIIGYVRQMGMEGALMWIIAGILCFFVVYKYIYLFSSLYVLMLLMGFGFTSAIMWGSATMRNKVAEWKATRAARPR